MSYPVDPDNALQCQRCGEPYATYGDASNQNCTYCDDDKYKKLRAENAELRERLAEAEKTIRNAIEEVKTGMVMWNDSQGKLAATEALLAEWVAWGKEYVTIPYWLEKPPMPKERVE